ncbi:helix-turn-helix transcriptional regulator [Mycobacteroides abscessus]|uniref:Bacterial regulatory helix-turn-helix s, AraC family protein n=2 Tax=Mycobacteroides abscessus TaxID=36809 RepID=X8DFX4_9MYCO|nr:helix-turn-helix transcriptional regulator [Mycobacteroides abscessus]EUA67527.1 bacterial regulatory helix-turn-helix s, AraC family protein [Mycobacteroides abscessus subsp. bolletii 1513]AMU33175.1 AraC family transcriptional regulator [Mycobacteroides abscessus]AMU67958.1 AraC family transcriptional regulator [Mycobacteroides abscessus]AMU77680.1 AraC family transcriptional regulator [Mycobacteroides abscessus]ANO01340.1 AraC family transcriptional regulator [Mycobacteroides abscessus]
MRFTSDLACPPSWRPTSTATMRTNARHLTVWDGTRPRTPRTWQSRVSLTVGGAEYVFATEQIATPTDWFFHEGRHVVVVHRRGRLRTMELEFEGGPSGRADPQVGDIWLIPADRRYCALAHGSTVEYCQMTLPPRFLEKADLEPTIRQRDPLTYRVIEQISTVAGREDAFARLSAEWLTETLLRHLTTRFATGSDSTPGLYRSFGAVDRAALIEYLDECPDPMIGLPQLAAHVGMTTREFTKAFAAAFHTTPHQLLLDRKIAKAKRLLIESTASIAEISAQLGFLNPDHLWAAFAQRVGTTPSGYRQSTAG